MGLSRYITGKTICKIKGYLVLISVAKKPTGRQIQEEWGNAGVQQGYLR